MQGSARALQGMHNSQSRNVKSDLAIAKLVEHRDLLSRYEYILDPQEEQAVQNKVFDLLGMKDDEKGMKLFKDIMEVVQNRSYITVFKLNGRSTTTRDIDIAILKSLLSG